MSVSLFVIISYPAINTGSVNGVLTKISEQCRLFYTSSGFAVTVLVED
jgi:hypothetical protein